MVYTLHFYEQFLNVVEFVTIIYSVPRKLLPCLVYHELIVYGLYLGKFLLDPEKQLRRGEESLRV